MGLVDREQAIMAINSRKINIIPLGPYDEYCEGLYAAYEAAIEELEELPSAEKTGRWKSAGMGDYMCSRCAEFVTGNRYNYCPNCGARMVPDEDKH